MKQKAWTNNLTTDWKSDIPSRGETLLFRDGNVLIANNKAVVEITYKSEYKKDGIEPKLYTKIIKGPVDRVYSAAIPNIPSDRLEKFVKVFDRKRINQLAQNENFREKFWIELDEKRDIPYIETGDVKHRQMLGKINREAEEKFKEKRDKEFERQKAEINKFLSSLDAKPSEEKKIQKKDLGIYGYKSPGEMLSERIAASGITTKELSDAQEFVDTSMIQKQIKGVREISRDQAIIYARVFGCAPADILFPQPQIPIWGFVNFLDFTEAEVPYGPCEIRPQAELPLVTVPANLYRPDIKAIQIRSSGSSLDENVLFYYSSNNVQQDCLNKLCIIGEEIIDFDGPPDDFISNVHKKYYCGILETHRGKSQVVNPDPYAKDTLDDKYGIHPATKLKPIFASPVVAMINPNQIIKDKYSAELFKRNTAIYKKTRNEEHAHILLDEKRKLEVDNLIKKTKADAAANKNKVKKIDEEMKNIMDKMAMELKREVKEKEWSVYKTERDAAHSWKIRNKFWKKKSA